MTQLYPAGPTILAMTWFDRRVGATSGKEFLRCSFRIVQPGPYEAGAFVCAMPVDMSHPATRRRWALWIEAAGNLDKLDASDDAAIMKALRGRAFKAWLVLREVPGVGHVNDIGLIETRHRYTLEDRRVVSIWNVKWRDGEGAKREPGWHPDAESLIDDSPIDPYVDR